MTTPASSPKSLHISWDRFHQDSKVLPWRLLDKQKEEKKEWKGIIAITRGGMFPAGIVARELDIQIIESVGISSYNDKEQKKLELVKPFNEALTGRGAGWLVIDDLVDTGNTVEELRKKLPAAHYATVYAKPKGITQADTYVTEVSQDTWIYFPWDLENRPVAPIVSSQKNG